MVAARIATLSHGGDRVSEQAANLPVATQSDAGALLNVSERSVERASIVKDDDVPELAAAVLPAPNTAPKGCQPAGPPARSTHLRDRLRQFPTGRIVRVITRWWAGPTSAGAGCVRAQRERPRRRAVGITSSRERQTSGAPACASYRQLLANSRHVEGSLVRELQASFNNVVVGLSLRAVDDD